jgi:protein gp37
MVPLMGDKTAIEWTSATWNPVTGCDRVSEGCDHCYALTLARRLKAMGNPRYQVDGHPGRSGPGFGVTLHEDQLDLPLRWRRSRTIFVNSMSDLFHDDVPNDFIHRVWAVMYQAYWHTFQVLTKRPGRMASVLSRPDFAEHVRLAAEARQDDPQDIYVERRPWPPQNVWVGTSVENQRWANVRIPKLLETPAAVRFLSCEPLLGPVDLKGWFGVLSSRDAALHASIDWVIVGGESGPEHRQIDLDWARRLRDQCVDADVAFFFKQVGGHTPKAGGRLLDGRTWDAMPELSQDCISAGAR